MTKSEDTDESLMAIEYRLVSIEALLKQILELLQTRRSQSYKRQRSATEKAYQAIVASGFEPTDEQRRAARLALARVRQRDAKRR